MSRLLDGVDDVITFAVGAAANLPTGALTWATIWRPNANHRGGLFDATVTGTRQMGINPFDNGDVFIALNGFTSTGYAAYEDQWALLAFTKAAGNATVRAHTYRYDTDTWTHTDLGAVNVRSAIDQIKVGSFDSGQFLNANLAVMAAWVGTALSDGALEALTAALADWVDAAPSVLWAFDQDDVGDPVLDLMESGADQTAITGTTVSADEPPGFSYSLGSTATLDATLPALIGAVTARAVARATAAAMLPSLTASLAAGGTATASLAASLPSLTAGLAGMLSTTGQLAATLPALTAQFTDNRSAPAGRGAVTLRDTGTTTLLDRPGVSLR